MTAARAAPTRFTWHRIERARHRSRRAGTPDASERCSIRTPVPLFAPVTSSYSVATDGRMQSSQAAASCSPALITGLFFRGSCEMASTNEAALTACTSQQAR